METFDQKVEFALLKSQNILADFVVAANKRVGCKRSRQEKSTSEKDWHTVRPRMVQNAFNCLAEGNS